jgi:hypothetical protein
MRPANCDCTLKQTENTAHMSGRSSYLNGQFFVEIRADPTLHATLKFFILLGPTVVNSSFASLSSSA